MDKNVFKDITYGMYVVATKKKRNVGCFINTLIQITSDKPMVAISLNKENYTSKVLKDTKKFSVSILKEVNYDKIISTFGYSSSEKVDKFVDVDYEEILSVPVVKEDMCGYFICNVVNVVDCGTHELFIAEVLSSEKIEDFPPMSYQYYHKVLKGKAPKKAPTYIEEPIDKTSSKKYQCIVCGYIYDDGKEAVAFEDLPDDWVCPRCGVKKEMFKRMDSN